MSRLYGWGLNYRLFEDQYFCKNLYYFIIISGSGFLEILELSRLTAVYYRPYFFLKETLITEVWTVQRNVEEVGGLRKQEGKVCILLPWNILTTRLCMLCVRKTQLSPVVCFSLVSKTFRASRVNEIGRQMLQCSCEMWKIRTCSLRWRPGYCVLTSIKAGLVYILCVCVCALVENDVKELVVTAEAERSRGQAANRDLF